ncbi:PIN domain-containing protein [Cytobacillus solani]|uniref:DUF4935 domain-containing protein n=1 Tax=Cytobacillus solani TaxID=1637975 RepID=A0A0Q3QU25_9BACI|nr:PIN domain-containing protein [Cytobacillus solani]KQL21238.1 hypothetical protein AN957_23515 [Cytobacillus solani]
MNIFLDSNAFYKDPFLIKGKNRILLSLAKHDDVKIYINDTVYEEIFRAHKNLLEKEINIISESFAKINTFLEIAMQKFEIDVDLDVVLQVFSSRFVEIQDAEQMEIIPYDGDVLKYIVEIDMYEKAPFITKTEMKNNKDQKITITKKEIRDAIIWCSYQVYIKKNNLDDCYFISNNTREFGDDEAKKSPVEQPYNLHPKISNNNLIAYKTVHDFLVHNDEKVKDLFYELHSIELSEKLFDKLYEELNEGLAEELVTKLFTEEIISEAQQHLSDFQTNDIHDDYYMGGYVSPSMYGQVNNIQLIEVDIYGGNITVAVDLEVEMDVEVYLYNPAHDDRNDKFYHAATDTMEVQESVIFLIPINVDNELDEDTFSLKEYIKGTEVGNLNVDIIATKNIDHTDMFREYEYEY